MHAWRKDTNCHPCVRAGPELVGGREGIRTPDPLLAKQVLSQLSYTPTGRMYLLILKYLQPFENQENTGFAPSASFSC